jgi:putative endonuclease
LSTSTRFPRRGADRFCDGRAVRLKDAVGRFGEQVAADHVRAAGMTVLDRNWRCRDGELDLVARDGDELVFVEVKTRSSSAFGTPAEAVDHRKAARLRRLALRWMEEARGREPRSWWRAVRFDVVCVVRERGGPPHVDVVRGAF